MRDPVPDLQPKFLIYGKNGWIGGLVGELLKKEGAEFEYGTARLEDRAGIIADVDRVRLGVGTFSLTTCRNGA